jgi:hypothetical protein
LFFENPDIKAQPQAPPQRTVRKSSWVRDW